MQHHAAWVYIIVDMTGKNTDCADVLDAVENVNADTVYILPNNKNIILAAEQAAHMSEDKKIVVIPTKTVPQGITAVINFLITAFVIFILIKVMNVISDKLSHKPEEPAAPTTKVCPYCRSTIAMEAVRCPHCTSQLDESK